jgi:hypothetical protein
MWKGVKIMAVDCTNITLELDTVDTLDADAATADADNLAEVFTITPTKRTDKMIILVEVANSHGTVECALGAGDYWAATEVTFDAVQNKTSVFHVSDIARFMTEDGEIKLTLTPASGKKLLTNHAATVQVIELP